MRKTKFEIIACTAEALFTSLILPPTCFLVTVPEDYLRNLKPEENTMKAEELEKKEDNEETKMDVCEDKLTAGVKSDVQEASQESPNDPAAETQMEKRSSAKDKKSGKQPEEKSAKKRKADSEINPEVLLVCFNFLLKSIEIIDKFYFRMNFAKKTLIRQW